MLLFFFSQMICFASRYRLYSLRTEQRFKILGLVSSFFACFLLNVLPVFAFGLAMFHVADKLDPVLSAIYNLWTSPPSQCNVVALAGPPTRVSVCFAMHLTVYNELVINLNLSRYFNIMLLFLFKERTRQIYLPRQSVDRHSDDNFVHWFSTNGNRKRNSARV